MGSNEEVIDPQARDKYLLEVTVGPSYDASAHQQVSVNGSKATRIESEIITAWIKVRIKGYNGLPRGSPTSSSYFDHSLHTSDRYSIGFSFVPHRDVNGSDLVMGFDYDHSIKHQLPPGFKYALKIVTTFLDPGLYSDPYCDEPYVYGPALSSFFAFRIGDRTDEVSAEDQLANLEKESDGVVEEGADGSGQSIREELGLPVQWKKRRKHFLNAQALANFTFQQGRMYHADFFNPHLDFANFALCLPGGFSIAVARYIDDKTHHLRFVLKNKKTEEVYFVVLMKLLFGKELEQRVENEKKSDQEKSRPDVIDASGAEEREPHNPHDRMVTDASIPSHSFNQSTAELDSEGRKDQGVATTASNAAASLASSVYGVYAALGFAHPSSSSESEDSSRKVSPKPSQRSLEARIDDMDDSAIESYLQSRSQSAE